MGSNKVTQIIFSIVLVFSVMGGQACAAVLSPAVWKTPCQKNTSIRQAAAPLKAKPCTVSPCRSDAERLFTLPDAFAYRLQRENQEKSETCIPDGISGARNGSFSPLRSGAHPPDLFPVSATPKFIANCSFLW